MLHEITKTDLLLRAGMERVEFLIDVCLIKKAEHLLGNIMLQHAQSELCLSSFRWEQTGKLQGKIKQS